MSREVRRVALDFDWPLETPWKGYLSPDRFRERDCLDCDGRGYSDYARYLFDRWYGNVPFDPSETGCEPLTMFTPEVRARAARTVGQDPEYYGTGPDAVDRMALYLCNTWNRAWMHHLEQADVDALLAEDRLYDFTHIVVKGEGWKRIEPAPTVTAEQVNRWAISGGRLGLGHDSFNSSVVVEAACKRAGQPKLCPKCSGECSFEVYPGQRAEAAAWEPEEPPAGDGWQLWETVSEGSPISPVFVTADELAAWMSDPKRGRNWLPGHVARKFIDEGWAPSLISSDEESPVPGPEWVGTHADDER